MMQLEQAPSIRTTIVRRLAPSYAAMGRFGLILVMLLMMAVLTILQPAYFLTRENLTNIARQISSNSILALGEFAVIVTAGIGRSVGSVMGLSMIVLALAVHADWAAGLAVAVALLVGLGVGLVNGLALTRLHLPHTFIATLATLNIARGATYLLSGGVPISGLPPIVRMWGANDITLLGGTSFPIDFPISFLIVIALYLAMWVLWRKTSTGRHIYAIGGSPKAAQYAGINIPRTLALVYVLSGGLAGIAGILLAGRVNSGYPTRGPGAELDAIAAVIIGGASFFGGRGTAGGVFIGAIIMGLLRNGLNLMNVSVFWQQVMLGFIILLAVYLDVLGRRAMRLESLSRSDGAAKGVRRFSRGQSNGPIGTQREARHMMARRITGIVTALLVVLALLTPGISEGAAKYTILLSMKGPGSGNPFWAAVERGARDTAKAMVVNLVVLAPPAETDVQAQIAQIEDQIAKRVNAIVVANGLMPLGAAAAVKARGKAGKVLIVGFDAIPEAAQAILSGTMAASVAQSPYNMGKFGVQNALRALTKKSVAKRIDTGTVLVTKKNAAQYAK